MRRKTEADIRVEREIHMTNRQVERFIEHARKCGIVLTRKDVGLEMFATSWQIEIAANAMEAAAKSMSIIEGVRSRDAQDIESDLQESLVPIGENPIVG